MSGSFTVKCSQCGRWGHRRVDCPNNGSGGDTKSVDESVYREPPAFGGHYRAGLYNEQFEQGVSGFGGSMNAPPPPFFNHQQQAYEQQQQAYEEQQQAYKEQQQAYEEQQQAYKQQQQAYEQQQQAYNHQQQAYEQQQQAYQPQPQQQHQQGPLMPGAFIGVQAAPQGQRNIELLHNTTPAEPPGSNEEFRRETGIQNPGVTFTSGQTAREMQPHYNPLSIQAERERMRRRRLVDISTVPVMDMSDPARPTLVPQRQAGRGALPGARNAQPNRGGHGMLGHNRVEKPRAQGQEQRQGAIQGSGRREKPRHDDHPPGFACRVCGNTDHTEADCAKPSKAGDSTYCPYHRTVSGSESHAKFTCRKCVDKCWEAAVDEDGKEMARAQIDRVVTDFVRAHRGGRPEPRCATVHSHWAMCMSRHIRANGLDGLNASLLPVRRSEEARRVRSGELSWQEFNHENVVESRRQFRDTHWDFESAEELIEKLQNHARTGTYRTASQLRGKRAAQDEEAAEGRTDAMDVEDQSVSSRGEESPESDHSSDAQSEGSDDVGNGLGSGEHYGSDHEGSGSEERRSEAAPEAGSARRWAAPRPKESYAPGAVDDAHFGDSE